MTPHELNLHIYEYNERQKHEDENRILQAYLVAAWDPMRTKQLPRWTEIVNQMKPKDPQTNEQMFEKVKILNAMFGGTVMSE